MQYSADESVEHVYDIYYTENGERVIVLEGLKAGERPYLHPMQEYLYARVDRIETFYWLLLVGVIGYLLVRNVVLPLYHRWALR